MAQLSDDCFAFGGPMMSVDEAVAIIAARVTPVREVETVSLAEADGRILASDISAPLPLPPFTNSAVDGYAVRSGDLPPQGEQAFPVRGRVQAGASAQEPARPGHAIRIFTGAPMPEGADTVFMQEDVRLDEKQQGCPAGGPERRRQCAPRGRGYSRRSFRAQGRPAAAAAGLSRWRPRSGLTHVEVRRRIRVAVFSTGNELVSPGAPRAAAQLFDSNRFMLMAMFSRLGCEVSDLGILRDDRASLARGLKQVAAAHDLILTTGGVSTGEEDHVKAGVEDVGTLVLWRMAIKPGRPVAMGIIGGHAVHRTTGKSGGEFCHLCSCGAADGVGAGRRHAAAARADAGARRLHLQEEIARREYVRVNLRKAPDGVLEAAKFPREGAGLFVVAGGHRRAGRAWRRRHSGSDRPDRWFSCRMRA
jgi:molybdopterin molybdotransferase